MGTQPTNKNNAFITLAAALLCGILFLQSITGCDNQSSSTTYTPDRGSFDHRYATERFRQEGMNRADAEKAADAVIRFQRAQQNR